ncbi:MAG: glycosyltransferase family 4 protein [Anaerolineaceae bacterium]|nr:glycosyltransferase family 4 protein [Anaerolineaceae bacterium]
MTKPQAILFVGTQMAVGGAQKLLLQLASWFHQRGCRVTAAFFYDRDNLAQEWQDRYPFPVLALGRWKKNVSAVFQAWRVLQSLSRLFVLMKKERFSSMLVFTHHSSLLALPLAWLAGIPVRVASHRGRILGLPCWQEHLHAWMINVGLSTALVAVSEQVRQQSVEEGIRPEKIVVIPNGVDQPDIPSERAAAVREGLALQENGFLILSAGRLWAEKGHVHLVNAMPEILRAAPNAILALAGEGALRTELEAQARSLEIAEHVRFLGTRLDVLDWMAAADVFVLPSNSEGMPNALLEAMALGRAVVATRVGGVPEVVKDGQNGLLVPPQNPSALASAILHLLLTPQERQRLGQNARLMIQQNFEIEKMRQQYAALLEPRFHKRCHVQD